MPLKVAPLLHFPTHDLHLRDPWTLSCASQVNLDFESERDMTEKFRIGLALQPIANALFAASPFIEGKPSG